MKCQILFSGKNKKNIINLSSAENAQRVVKVKIHTFVLALYNMVTDCDWLRFKATSTFVGHFVSSPREREKSDRIVEEMKERDREERGTGMKVKEQKDKNIPHLPLPATRIAGLAQL